MSRVTPTQASFNGGEVSERLRARIDQQFYGIALAEMTGFAPLVEGPAEACPGTIYVAAEPGPFRAVRFEYSATQGHVLAFSDELVRIYTNDAFLVEIESPFSWAEVQQLTFHQSYDVLYCFHHDRQPQMLVRTGADTFVFEAMEFTDGPFKPRNTDESIRISADGLTGTVTLTASSAVFAATDVGRLVRIEAEDFGDITAWEPYITVTTGQFLSSGERVYRVIGGNPDGLGVIRTGSLIPAHTEGVEWDGIAKGEDINGSPGGGVRLEYIHDRYGIVLITVYVSATEVDGTVQRRLPFSATAAPAYDFAGGYWDAGYTVYTPPPVDVDYAYGSYRWSLGAFSDTTGWPSCGTVWNERLMLAKDNSVHGSVRGDLASFADRNEVGEISADMAFEALMADPNAIRHLVAAERLLVLTAGGVHALVPASAAQGVGPGNVAAFQQNDAGCSVAMPVLLNSRTIHISRAGDRVYETDIDPSRGVESEIDLTRYARHIGKPGLVEVVAQQHPFNHLWLVRGDGTLALASYLPEEQVLGFATRPMAAGVEARTIAAITDPDGHYEQVWVGVEYDGGWHMLRMAPWRLDGEDEATACMVDMAVLYDGADEADHANLALPEADLHVVADGQFYAITSDAEGAFTLPFAAGKVWHGLPFPAAIESLNLEMGGDSGPARARKARIGRAWVEVLRTQGLAFGVPGSLRPLEELQGDSLMDRAFPAFSGFKFREAVGDHTRYPRLRIERQAPFQCTLVAWGGVLNMEVL